VSRWRRSDDRPRPASMSMQSPDCARAYAGYRHNICGSLYMHMRRGLREWQYPVTRIRFTLTQTSTSLSNSRAQSMRIPIRRLQILWLLIASFLLLQFLSAGALARVNNKKSKKTVAVLHFYPDCHGGKWAPPSNDTSAPSKKAIVRYLRKRHGGKWSRVRLKKPRRRWNKKFKG